jgi:hypothetical protein
MKGKIKIRMKRVKAIALFFGILAKKILKDKMSKEIINSAFS